MPSGQLTRASSAAPKDRAAAEGGSLSAFVAREFARIATRPTSPTSAGSSSIHRWSGWVTTAGCRADLGRRGWSKVSVVDHRRDGPGHETGDGHDPRRLDSDHVPAIAFNVAIRAGTPADHRRRRSPDRPPPPRRRPTGFDLEKLDKPTDPPRDHDTNDEPLGDAVTKPDRWAELSRRRLGARCRGVATRAFGRRRRGSREQ